MSYQTAQRRVRQVTEQVLVCNGIDGQSERTQVYNPPSAPIGRLSNDRARRQTSGQIVLFISCDISPIILHLCIFDETCCKHTPFGNKTCPTDDKKCPTDARACVSVSILLFFDDLSTRDSTIFVGRHTEIVVEQPVISGARREARLLTHRIDRQLGAFDEQLTRIAQTV
jgi:hypothetical protein